MFDALTAAVVSGLEILETILGSCPDLEVVVLFREPDIDMISVVNGNEFDLTWADGFGGQDALPVATPNLWIKVMFLNLMN